MNERKIEYKTLDEIKMDIITRIVTNSSPVSITRCYETISGSSISRGAGEEAPDGKFKIAK